MADGVRVPGKAFVYGPGIQLGAWHVVRAQRVLLAILMLPQQRHSHDGLLRAAAAEDCSSGG